MAPFPVVRRNPIPIVYDRDAVVSEVGPIRAWLYLGRCLGELPAGYELPSPHDPEMTLLERLKHSKTFWHIVFVLFYLVACLAAASHRWTDPGAVLIRTCDDGTEIYQMPDGEFVTTDVETVENPATACN